MNEHELKQMAHRMPVMDYLSQSYQDTGQVVIGIAMIVEIIDEHGERGVHKITSDAGGHPLPHYAVTGLSMALDDYDEFDDEGEA